METNPWKKSLVAPLVLFLVGTVPTPVLARTARLARSMASGTVYKYETTHFAIFYQTSGPNAVYNATQVDGNGVPVAIDSIGVFAERSWRLAIDTLGYKTPVGISSLLYYAQAVPTGKIPIEVADVGYASTDAPWDYATMGVTTDPSLDPQQLGCEIVVENDFLYGSSSKHIQAQVAQAAGGVLYDYSTDADIYKGWKVAVSHEFFHTVEFGYEYAYQYSFHEMSAVWFEIRAYPDIYHHWSYLSGFVSNKFGGAFATGGSVAYGNHVFVREFAHIFGDSSIRKIWEFRSRRMYIDTGSLTEGPWFADAMDSLGYSQFTLIKDYSVQIADLLYNRAGLFNDGALYVNPAYTTKRVLSIGIPVAGTSDQAALGPNPFGADDFTYSWTSVPSGLHLKIDSVTAQVVCFGYIVHLPSMKIEAFDNHVKSAVLAIDTGDTGMSVGLVGGNPYAGALINFSYDPVTGIMKSNKLPAMFVPTRRVDIFGRPVNPDARGLVIESDGVKTVPAIQLR
jgi:hypothetical protein